MRVNVDRVLGDAEWAATQTLHLADSTALACWCRTAAIADQNVSKSNKHAIRLDIERKAATPRIDVLIYTKTSTIKANTSRPWQSRPLWSDGGLRCP